MFPTIGRKENSTLTIGNRGTFIGTDEFISKYIHWYLKSMNIGYIHRFGLDTDKFTIYSLV
jgi:hypothetical protein